MEMWALFNFVAPDVLGEPADFRWASSSAGVARLARHFVSSQQVRHLYTY